MQPGIWINRATAIGSRTRDTCRRLSLYFSERFPWLSHGILIASFYSSSQFLAQALSRPGTPMRYDRSTILGSVTLLLFFLHLRIFDDHKDYTEDCRYFPDRVLQRGEVSLGELKIVAGCAIAGELLCAALRGPAAVVAVAMAIAFSVLMLREFFLRGFLKQHLLLYAATHMLVMPVLSLAVFSFATGKMPWNAPLWYLLYASVGFFVGFNWEVSRKIRAPEEEVTGVDTYTQVFGTYGAAYLVLLIRIIDTLLVSFVGWHLGLGPWFYVWLVGLFFVCLVGFVQFRFHTSPTTARRMATYAGIYVVAFDLALAAALGRLNGVAFGGGL